MKNIIMAVVITMSVAGASFAQDCGRHMPNKMRFKVVKPASVVKSTVTFTTKTGKQILCSAKKVVSAPFKDVEFRTFEYTLPSFRFEKGTLKEIDPLKPMNLLRRQREKDLQEEIPEIEIYDGVEDGVYPLHYPLYYRGDTLIL